MTEFLRFVVDTNVLVSRLLAPRSTAARAVDQALARDSQFRQALARYRPGRTAVTLWTYEDSFETFRRLRKDLYEQGFLVAARPLPSDMPIGGSPGGTRSAVQ